MRYDSGFVAQLQVLRPLVMLHRLQCFWAARRSYGYGYYDVVRSAEAVYRNSILNIWINVTSAYNNTVLYLPMAQRF